MTKKLSHIAKNLSTFIDNQVLTSEHLNDAHHYLDYQNRNTRVLLNGVGILNGFDVKYENKYISISPGVGITTDGDIITLNNYYQQAIGHELEASNELRFTHYEVFEDKLANYENFTKKGKPTKLYELIDCRSTPSNFSQTVNKLSNLENMVVILYLEAYTKEPGICTTIDCNDQGKKQISKLRVLITDEANAAIISNNDSTYGQHAKENQFLNLPNIALPRIVISRKHLISADSLKQKFALENERSSIYGSFESAINQIFENFGEHISIHPIKKLYKGTLGDTTSFNFRAYFKDKLLEKLHKVKYNNGEDDSIYKYQLIGDLIATYNEIKDCLLKLKSQSIPNINSFPKHIALGQVNAANILPKYRHKYYPTREQGHDQSSFDLFNSLLFRFYFLLEKYGISNDYFKITPSKKNALLGEKSIPCYYNLDTDLLYHWNFKKSRSLQHTQNLSYSTELLSEADHIQNPLKYDLSNFDFFRVEGLYASSATEAILKINNIIKQFGLDINFNVFDIETDKLELANVLSHYPGLEYNGGVPVGGTYILVKDKDEVITSLSIKHKIHPETDLLGRIEETSYPWISSLKYINNLVRSINDKKAPLQKRHSNYVLRISQYKINDTHLISNKYVDISISTKKMLTGRLHSVMNELNNHFDAGVVFEYDQRSKCVKIKRLIQDSFAISIQDITQNHNTPVYTYTHKGLKRGNNTTHLEAYSNTRELKPHHPVFYKSLHLKYDPLLKDDDYKAWYTKWEEWEVLKNKLVADPYFVDGDKKQFRYMYGDEKKLPNSVKNLLDETIIPDIYAKKTSAKIYLGGEYIDGSWVTQEMINDHKTAKSSHQIKKFIELRKELHKKSGPSKLIIHVTGLSEENLLKLEKDHFAVANFFLGKPDSEFAIELDKEKKEDA